jgi:hypothetical protein
MSGTPYYREFDATTMAFNATTMRGANAIFRYSFGQAAASSVCYEQIFVGITANNKVSGTRWDGSEWTSITMDKTNVLGTVSDTKWNNIVGAYESQSGRAIVIYNKFGTPSSPRFSIWDGSRFGSWPDSVAVDPGYSGGEPQWFDIASSRLSNELALVFSDNFLGIFVSIWNGSSWAPTIQIATCRYQAGIAVTYESLSGRAMVVFGMESKVDVYYRIWNGSTWEKEQLAFPLGTDSAINWVSLKSDPKSNRIILGIVLDNGCSWLSVWNGNSWEATAKGLCGLSDPKSPSLSVAFESNSGDALAVFGMAGSPKVLYKTLSNGSKVWSVETTAGTSFETPTSLALYPNPNLSSNQIMLMVQNVNGALYAVPWNGTSGGRWATELFPELDTNTGESLNRPFSFVWNPSPIVPLVQGAISAPSPTQVPIGPLTPAEHFVVWGSEASSRPRAKSFDGTSFGNEIVLPDVSGDWRWVRGARMRGRRGNEMIIVGVTDNNQRITGVAWDGSNWNALPQNPLSTAVGNDYWPYAAVTFESISGRGLIVWGDGPALKYQIWDSGSWNKEETVSTYSNNGGTNPHWLKIASDPNSNEVALAVGDSSSDNHVLIWDGEGWTKYVDVYSGAGSQESSRSTLSIAYESQSGIAMAVYGKDGSSRIYYRTSQDWNTEQSFPSPGISSQIYWTDLKSDPMSNHLVLGVQTSSGNVWLNVWDGSSWRTPQDTGAIAGATNHPRMSVAFEGLTSRALSVYSDGGKTIRYRTWTKAGGWTSQQSDGPSVGGSSPSTMSLDTKLKSNDIMLTTQDSSSNLYCILWNGSSFDPRQAITSTTGETKNMPFVFLWDNPPF